MKREQFSFVLEELQPIRPIVRRAFGFTYIYLEEKLLCCLRDSKKRPATNGLWLFTTSEHLDSLGREFPDLPRRHLWRSGENAWVVLNAHLEGFEEFAFKACELMVNGDRRIGRISRGKAGTTSPVL